MFNSHDMTSHRYLSQMRLIPTFNVDMSHSEKEKSKSLLKKKKKSTKINLGYQSET